MRTRRTNANPLPPVSRLLAADLGKERSTPSLARLAVSSVRRLFSRAVDSIAP